MIRHPRAPLAVYALTGQSARLASRLAASLGADLFLPARFAAEHPGARGFEALAPLVSRTFRAYAGHVFIAAAGIVVRTIAPLLRDKTSDPAVVVLDQEGRFAVSLLSGHLGGANDLARRVAELTGGQPVVTTATDAAGLPSLDILARDLGLVIENVEAVKWANGALLEGRRLKIYDPEGLLAGAVELADHVLTAEHCEAADVVVSWRTASAPERALILRPRRLVAGIGCRRGVSADEIEDFVRGVFAERGWSPLALDAVGTIEKKRDEAGLVEAVRRLGAELVFFEAKRLCGVAVPTPSLKPLEHVGSASVCEASAMLLCDGRLIMPKVKSASVTLAVGLGPWPRS